jgi:hypothetical protein
MIAHEDIDDGPLSSKLHKVWCCPKCCLPCNGLFHSCRKAVSGKKKRFIQNGFDLDLAYITPNIIVHGFPAAGIEHLYRNPRYEIRRFMDTYHLDNYKMYNFCCEPGRGYHPDVYHGRVERYPFKDHNTPPLETMVAFANSAMAWLEEDRNHVVNMHCKAGKGRAGLMCCVLLIRTGAAQSALEAMDLYDRERVTNLKGLTVTSQRKFVIFYEALWRQCWGITGNIGDVSAEVAGQFKIPNQPSFNISRIEVLNVPLDMVHSYHIVTSRISNFGPKKVHASPWLRPQPGTAVLCSSCDATVTGNFKIFVYFKKSPFSSPIRLIELQHNTFFMLQNTPSCDFSSDQLDIKKKFKSSLGNAILRLTFSNNTVALIGDASDALTPLGGIELPSMDGGRKRILGGTASGVYTPVTTEDGAEYMGNTPPDTMASADVTHDQVVVATGDETVVCL